MMVVTLNRPAKRNAVSLAMWRRLGELFSELGEREPPERSLRMVAHAIGTNPRQSLPRLADGEPGVEVGAEMCGDRREVECVPGLTDDGGLHASQSHRCRLISPTIPARMKETSSVPSSRSAAGLTYTERILAGGSGPVVDKTARLYEIAKAMIKVGEDRSERSLRAERRLFVAQKYKDQALVYSPLGPLTREEADLTSQHFDTLSLAGLLPGKTVASFWPVRSSASAPLWSVHSLSTVAWLKRPSSMPSRSQVDECEKASPAIGFYG